MPQDTADDVERDRRAMDIFVQACGLAGGERAALLEQLCGDDSAVRRRVDAMLKADESGGADTPVGSNADVDDFMARQIGELTGSAASSDLPGMSTAAQAVDGEYTLLRVIGEGGMGTVYEAEQHTPRRRVAIKAIRPGRMTPQMTKRFEYEAQVLARLEHPNIARLYESNTESDGGHVRAYLAMELVDGVPIDAYCVQRELTIEQRLRLFMKVCEAVAYAHRMGVIHRDLKPANILVTEGAEPKVLDFGVARTVTQDKNGDGVTLVTQHGQIVGTLAYMSPEQVEGRADVDTRTDVYSLGVILYRLLTGQLPIDVSSDSIVGATTRILNEMPARISHHDRRLKGDLDVVVCRSLEKDPARRYASVDQVREELDRHLSGRPIEARADSAIYVLRKAVWRHRGPVTIAVLLLVLLTTFGVVASIQAERNRQLAITTEIARHSASMQADELRHALYFSNIGFAHAALANNDMERAYRLLDGCDEDLREWEWYFLQRLRDLSHDTVSLKIDRPRYASFSADRKRLALASLDREVLLLDTSDPVPRDLFRSKIPPGAARAVVSPDGRWLAYGGTVDDVTLVELATGATRPMLTKPQAATRPGQTRPLRVLRFSNDSKTLLSAGMDFQARLWDVTPAPAPPRVTIPLGDAMPICAVFARDGAWIVIGDAKHAVRMFDAQTGQLTRAFVGHDAPVWAVALSDDGSQLASGDNDARTNVWDPATGELLEQDDTDDGWVTALCFSPTGDRLAVGRADSVVRLLHVRSMTQTGVLRGHRHAVTHIDWQLDDTLHTIGLDATLKTWDADAALQVPTITTGQSECNGLAFDPSGKRVFVGGIDGTVRSWDVSGPDGVRPAEGRRLADHVGSVLEIDVDPTGRWIATGAKEFGPRTGAFRLTRLDRPDEPPLLVDPKTGGVPALDFSPDGKRLAVGTDREVTVWDVAAGQVFATLSAYQPAPAPAIVANELRFDRRGEHVYGACADGHLRRWHVESKSLVRDVMVDAHGLYDVQLNPAGDLLAVAGDTSTVVVLDAYTLQEKKRYAGHQGGVLGVAFDPTGRRLASCGTDGSIRIWDIESGAEIICLRGHRRRVQHIAFSPDGRTLASSSDDGTVKLWRTIAPPAVNAATTTTRPASQPAAGQ